MRFFFGFQKSVLKNLKSRREYADGAHGLPQLHFALGIELVGVGGTHVRE
jgi:hypothetical protein